MKNKRLTNLTETAKNLFGGAPIYISNEKQKEWDEAPENIKRWIKANLEEAMKEMTMKIQIETLCHLLNDQSKRIDDLERIIKEKKKPQKDWYEENFGRSDRIERE